MTPYYTDNLVTLYHGDCRDILPWLTVAGDVAVASDPPYGIGHRHSGKGRHAHHHAERGRRNVNLVAGDDEPFDPSHLLAMFDNVLLWGANHYAKRLPDGGRWLAWDKLAGMKVEDSFSDVEFAWHSRGKASRIINFAWKGVASVKAGEDNGRRWHPTQKPVGVMVWSIGQTGVAPGGTIIDPYLGSGTTAVAARRTGHRFIGIEMDEGHLRTAVRRLAQGVLDFGESAKSA
jgi:hypothetical protein